MSTVTPEERAVRYRAALRLPTAVEDWEFTSVLISRPVGFVLLHAIERFAFVTPNRITVLGFACFAGAIALLHQAPQAIWVIAALLFWRLIFDDFDGMLARTRRSSSHFGSYLDKVTDVLGFFGFFTVLGLRASAEAGGALWPLVLSSAGVTALVTTGYVKWVVRGMEPPAPPSSPAPGEASPNAAPGPPARHPVRIFLILLVRLFGVNECDIFLFSIVMILLGLVTPLLWVLAGSQIGLCLAMIVKRGWRAWQLDRKRR